MNKWDGWFDYRIECPKCGKVYDLEWDGHMWNYDQECCIECEEDNEEY